MKRAWPFSKTKSRSNLNAIVCSVCYAYSTICTGVRLDNLHCVLDHVFFHIMRLTGRIIGLIRIYKITCFLYINYVQLVEEAKHLYYTQEVLKETGSTNFYKVCSFTWDFNLCSSQFFHKLLSGLLKKDGSLFHLWSVNNHCLINFLIIISLFYH